MLPASIVAEFKSAHGRYAALDDQSMESPNGSLQKPVRAKKLFLERCIWSAWSAFLLSVLIWIIASTKACVSRGINATPSTYEAGFDTDLGESSIAILFMCRLIHSSGRCALYSHHDKALYGRHRA